MSDPLDFPEPCFVKARFNATTDAKEFVSIYIELRNAYLHALSTNRTLRASITELSRDYHKLLKKYHVICADHDALIDENISDL